MKMVMILIQKGKYSKSITANRTPLADFVDQKGYNRDRKKMAVNLMAFAMGLHGNPTQLAAKFNLVTKH